MYRITDDYGTSQTCWTWAEAVLWLAACSPTAQITNRLTGKLIASRTVVRAGGAQ